MIQSCIWSSKQCGCWLNNTDIKFKDKIVGGFESIPHSWPWIVSIQIRSSDKSLGLPICGGTLISERHILTAAHCFYESLVIEKKSINIYLFIIGAHYTSDTHVYSDSIFRRTASSIILHETYNSRRQTDDIALVTLEENINFDNIHVGAICLPNQFDTYSSDGTYTVAIGWGRISETAKEGSPTLQQVLLVITEGQQCDRIKSGNQINTQICAGSVDSHISQDTCQGDSGGPLMIRTNDDLWELVGITSYGKGCGRLNELGVYTHVRMYLQWINLTIKTSEGYSLRSLNKPDNIFLNSTNKLSNSLVFLILIQLNKFFFD